MELVFATNNDHKLYEIRSLLGEGFRIKSLEEIGCREEIPEDQSTLEGNAVQKACYIYDHYGYDCFADDTGLEVNALQGAPGVISARYAGLDKNPEENMKKLLTELAEINDRRARFRTVIALVLKGKAVLFEGVAEGVILKEKRGTEGFGYDPVFLPEGHSLSFAEMSLEEKNSISHRGKAVLRLTEFLKNRPA